MCLPVPVPLPKVCMGVPAIDRHGIRARRRTFVHNSYMLRWVRTSEDVPMTYLGTDNSGGYSMVMITPVTPAPEICGKLSAALTTGEACQCTSATRA